MALADLQVTMGEVGSLPFRINPKNGNNSVAFLKQWISENKELLDNILLQHGETWQLSVIMIMYSYSEYCAAKL